MSTSPQTVTVTGTVYLAGKGDVASNYLRASETERPEFFHFFAGKHDMSSCWTPLGKFTATVELSPPEDFREQAAEAIRADIAELNAAYHTKRQYLENQLANLLCLEAPSND